MTLLEHRWGPLAVLVLALLSLAIGLADLPVQDRDEARFAQASRQMAATGDLIDIRFQDQARHNKPALIYWAQTAAIWITGQEALTPIWVHRVPSWLAGAFAATALIWAGTPLAGRRAAVLAGIMCATVYMVHAEARTAKTDAALLLSVIIAMGALARAWINPQVSRLEVAVFWIALAAGFLLKGPMVALPVIGAAIWCSVHARSVGWLNRLRPVPGAVLFIALSAPWFVAITIITDGAFWEASVGADLTDKITADGEHTARPPGLYLLTIWATFFPWTLLIPAALAVAWRSRKAPQTAFLLGWLIPGWLVFEATPVKLIHYTLPLYPALMLLSAKAVMQVATAHRRFGGPLAWIGTVGFGAGVVLFAALIIGAPAIYGPHIPPFAFLGAAAVFCGGVAGAVFFWRQAALRGVAALAGTGIAMGWTISAVSLPAASDLRLADRIAAAMAIHACLDGPVAMAGFLEPSVVFRLGTDTLLTDPESALSALAAGEVSAAWLPVDSRSATADRGVADITAIAGTNYANGSEVLLRLYIAPGVPAPARPCAAS